MLAGVIFFASTNYLTGFLNHPAGVVATHSIAFAAIILAFFLVASALSVLGGSILKRLGAAKNPKSTRLYIACILGPAISIFNLPELSFSALFPGFCNVYGIMDLPIDASIASFATGAVCMVAFWLVARYLPKQRSQLLTNMLGLVGLSAMFGINYACMASSLPFANYLVFSAVGLAILCLPVIALGFVAKLSKNQTSGDGQVAHRSKDNVDEMTLILRKFLSNDSRPLEELAEDPKTSTSEVTKEGPAANAAKNAAGSTD